jgi:TPR repeat protein
MLFIGGILASIFAFLTIIYLSIVSNLTEFSWFNIKIFDALLIGLSIGAVIHVLFSIALKLIPKSQSIKFFEKRKLFDDSDNAIKLFLSPLNLKIDEIIISLEKLTQARRFTSIYDLFESEDISNANKQKIGEAHFWLGFIYSSKYYDRFDFNRAVDNYQKSLAKKAECNFELAKLYYYGGFEGLDKINYENANHSLAIKYFLKAINKNKFDAYTYIGLILRSGSVKKNLFGFYENSFQSDQSKNRTKNKKLIKKSFEFFSKGVNYDYKSKYYFGVMNFLGEGCEKNYELALSNIEESISKFYDEEIKYLVEIYSEGKGVEIDLSKALTYSLIAVQYDESLNSYIEVLKSKLNNEIVADAYLKASSFTKNEIYLNYINIASKLNSIEAHVLLIDLYQHGFGDILNRDESIAFNLASQASSMDNATATNILAIMYESGKGVEKNIDEAMRLYKKASDLGSIDALVNMGINYHEGVHVDADIEKASECYLTAIQQNHHGAMINLSDIYLQNGNSENAINLLKNAILSNSFKHNKEAHYKLALIYLDENLSQHDYKLAYSHLKEVGNYLHSFGRLGYLYYFGYGIEQNYKLSKFYLEEYLILFQDAYSEYLLGWIYINGQGTEVDLNKAILYLERSAMKQMKDPIFLLSDIYFGKFDKSYKDLVHSLKWLYFASNIGFNESYENMKDIKEMLSSEGVEKAKKDGDEMFNMITKAI